MRSQLLLTALAASLALSSSSGAAETAPGSQENGATKREYGLALGIRSGYEWLNLKATGLLGTLDGSLKGWEFANIQFGADFRPSPFVSIGPFIALMISQYDHGDLTVGSFRSSGEISDKSVHEWLMFGLRGQFNINLN